MDRELSVGTILTDGISLLACQPFSRKSKPGNFDIPKGHWEDGETLLETALREMVEETGFYITHPEQMVDLGRFNYIPSKDLHIFFYAIDALPQPDMLKCVSTFEYKGRQVPEVIGYRHVDLNDLQWFFPSLQKVLAQALDKFATESE
jgi:8-oxo-dGTP pyrophosphatase MutT (NUDIX family)